MQRLRFEPIGIGNGFTIPAEPNRSYIYESVGPRAHHRERLKTPLTDRSISV